MKYPEIVTAKLEMRFFKTIKSDDGNEIDMYMLLDTVSGDGMVSFAVPKGRKDIAAFIYRSCVAGQRVLKECGITRIEDFKP